MAVKTCIRCGVTKPVSRYYKNPHMVDGRVNVCQMCKNQKARDRRNHVKQNAQLLRAWR